MKQMDRQYWDAVADDYEGSIFSVLDNDRDDRIVSAIEEIASPDAVATDFGCGIGKFLPALSRNFKHVYASDLSDALLSEAKIACAEFSNVNFAQADLAAALPKIPKVDLVLCVNVLIMPSSDTRSAILDNICRSLKRAGRLILVVPSLESALYTDYRLIQWNLKTGCDYDEAAWEVLEAEHDADASIREGLVEIDSVPTKHYLKEELIAMLAARKLTVATVDKVCYSWDTEFDDPPKWMKEPYPWDWLVVAKK